MPDIGATLREARMRQRIDISEIEAETKIRAKYLRALENEEWDLLPGPAYVKSFLRTYAESLGLDAKLLLEEYKLRHERLSDHELQPIAPRSASRRPERRRMPTGYLVGAVVVALLVGLAIIGLNSDDARDPEPLPNLSGSPGDTTPLPGTSRPRARRRDRATTTTGSRSKVVRLQIVPSAPVYVCLEAAGDRRPINGVVLRPGDRPRTYRSSRFEVTLGNGSVELRIDGKVRGVPEVSEGVGYVITKGNRKVLPPERRPTCGA